MPEGEVVDRSLGGRVHGCEPRCRDGCARPGELLTKLGENLAGNVGRVVTERGRMRLAS